MRNRFKEIVQAHWRIILFSLLVINFSLRLTLYYNTSLFNFSDYSALWNGMKELEQTGKLPLLSGNFQMTVSYLGYFLKNTFGSIDAFFILNSLLAVFSSLILFFLTSKVTGNHEAGLLIVLIHTIYTEFLVFSSVFYSPVILIFLLSTLLFFLYKYYESVRIIPGLFYALVLIIVVVTSYFFKPELIFLPFFLLIFSFFYIKSDRFFFRRTISIAILLFAATTLFISTGLFSKPEGSAISNDFVFFGHTDYGGDGGEGSFVYPENRARYTIAFNEYCKENGIADPSPLDKNRFQIKEVKKFVFGSPFKWIKLQFAKLFKEYGIVPETTSFKILYTGLFKGNLFLTAVFVVGPVVIIIISFIALFNIHGIRRLLVFRETDNENADRLNKRRNKNFLYVFLLLTFYYLIATVFFGHYQERYRISVIAIFVIPTLGFFITQYNPHEVARKKSTIIKGGIIALLLIIWAFQAEKALSNKDRFKNAIESAESRKNS